MNIRVLFVGVLCSSYEKNYASQCKILLCEYKFSLLEFYTLSTTSFHMSQYKHFLCEYKSHLYIKTVGNVKVMINLFRMTLVFIFMLSLSSLRPLYLLIIDMVLFQSEDTLHIYRIFTVRTTNVVKILKYR